MKSNAFKQERGWIEVICGPMFAGKSEELLRIINRLKYANVKHLLFKPVIDTRNNKAAASRDGRKHDAIEVSNAMGILEYIKENNINDVQVIAIDEAHFFDNELADVCDYLANLNYVIYVAGLDMDFTGRPFQTMLKIFAIAEKINKLTAICTECGGIATRSQRLINNKPAKANEPQVLVGNYESYTARCRHHHVVDNNDRFNKFPKIKKA